MSNSLVYIHKGYSWYVPLALLNGKQFYGRNVHYIGEAYGCFVARLLGVRAHRLRDYHSAADGFAKIYRHHSTLGYEFELFCIQRWFVLLEFLRKQGMDSCVYLDTDVLLAANLNGIVQMTRQFGLTFTGYSAHVCFVNRIDALAKLCDYVTSLYQNPVNSNRMVSWHKEMVGNNGAGGVSDMTAFYWFQKDHQDLIGGYPSIFGDSPIDVSLDDTRGFLADADGFKNLQWHGRIPHATAEDGQQIQFLALHHQGRGKELMLRNTIGISGGIWFYKKMFCSTLQLLYKSVVFLLDRLRPQK
jgi:hypothetical protein